jgi:predicted helicase
VICISGVGVTKEFSCIIVDTIPDLELIGKSQCFPLYWYEKNERDTLSLFDRGNDEFAKHSGVTNFILQRAREEYGPRTTADDVFYYVYGLLHNHQYRKHFSSDLKKSLARIPFDLSPQDFKSFVKAGRKLAELHLNYETGPLCQQLIITGDDDPNKLKVTKMRFPSKENKGTILFNESVKIENIPMVAYDYVVNGKSAVEWIMERYAVTKNSDSGIVNDPNLWSDNPRYILDLVSRVIQMSVETQKIVVGLPKLNFSPQRS